MTRKKNRGGPPETPPADAPPPKPRRPTERQMRFVREYIIDLNGKQAYLRAYGDTAVVNGVVRPRSVKGAGVQSVLMLRKPHVRAEVDAALAMVAARLDLRADRVLRELTVLAFSDLGDYFGRDPTTGRTVVRPLDEVPPEARRALHSVEAVTERDRATGVEEVVGYKYKLHDKRAALCDLGRHLNLFREREPLDALLALLPPGLGGAIRASLADALRAGGVAGVGQPPAGDAAPVDAVPRPADGRPGDARR